MSDTSPEAVVPVNIATEKLYDQSYVDAIRDTLSAKLTAALAAVEQARADGYAQGLRDAGAVCANTDFNYSDEVRVWEYVKHRILALLPAEPCDTKSAENVTQAGLRQSNAQQAIKPTPAPAGTTKGGTE
jgi:hypothetical protein